MVKLNTNLGTKQKEGLKLFYDCIVQAHLINLPDDKTGEDLT